MPTTVKKKATGKNPPVPRMTGKSVVMKKGLHWTGFHVKNMVKAKTKL